MPIVVKDFAFSETEDVATIEVKWPVSGITARNADIFANSRYVKVNRPPYIFELDLPHAIDHETSAVSIADGVVMFNLAKVQPQRWGTLANDLTREQLKQQRQEAMTRYHESIEEKKKQAQEEKWKQEREMVQRQIEVERAERAKIEERKQQEREEAEAYRLDEDDKRDTVDPVIFDECDLDAVVDSPADKAAAHKETDTDEQATAHAAEPLQEESSDDDDPDLVQLRQQRADIQAGNFVRARQQAEQERLARLPPPRSSTHIEIQFTQRPFKTAARESQDAKWLAAMQRAKEDRAHAGKKMDDTNPLFLRNKGNEFFKSSNFEAAINAYNASLQLDPTNITCLSNRAACNLKLERWEACTDDCDAALHYLAASGPSMDEEDANATIAANERKSKLLVRKGTACLRLGAMHEAIACYETACQLSPSDNKLYEDYLNLKQSVSLAHCQAAQ
ncbi:hypothetical protein RI367_004154 [Sorochytrium milnesiophthora]